MVVKDQNFLLSLLAFPLRGQVFKFKPSSSSLQVQAARLERGCGIQAFTNCLP
jgi:hypothetical protein